LVLVAVSLVAGAGWLSGSAADADVVSLPSGSVVRLAGANRYETAVAVSEATFAPPLDGLFVATGDNFPDALAAGPVAGLNPAWPILLVKRDSVPTSVADEIGRLAPDSILVLGGSAAVSDAVLDELDGLAMSGAGRVAGANRYETAAEVSGFFGAADVVFLATGQNFPDALSAGPPGGLFGFPMLLATSSQVPQATLDAMIGLGVEEVVFVGGTGVLPDALKSQITAAVGPVDFFRIAGSTRYETSAALADDFFDPVETDVAYIAVGDNFPDALAGSPSAAANEAPILLARKTCMPTATYQALQDLDVDQIVLLGGTGVLSDDAPFTEC
jgi:putative cell wall-binding protein